VCGETREADIDTTAERARDAALDLFRTTALGLMTAIHFARTIPTDDRLSEALKSLGSTAPALFFFAFGYTLPRFLAKPRREQAGLLTSFFLVACLHNVFMGALFQADFLAFLFLWNVILYTLDRQRRLGLRLPLLLALGFLALQLALPRGALSAIFRLLTPGAFPLLPWGILVLAGVACTHPRCRTARRRYLPFLGLILLALGLHLAYLLTGEDRLLLSQSPVSPAYLLLMIGACGTWLLAADRLARLFTRLPPLARAVTFTSRHLLLGTVFHYVTVFAAASLLTLLIPSCQIRRHDLPIILLGALGLALGSYVLLRLLVWAWSYARLTPLVQAATRQAPVLALVAIPLSALATAAAQAAMQEPNASSAAFLLRDLSSPLILRWGAKVLALGSLLFFALLRDRALEPEPALPSGPITR
jgi:hypothetical protein